MTSEAQDEAIALASGWFFKDRIKHNGEWVNVRTWFHPRYKDYDFNGGAAPLGTWLGQQPKSYTRDLNAMHEAEWVLIENNNWEGYSDRLMEIVVRGGGYQNAVFYFHASAAQRAEAFLRALNLWDNSK